MATRWFHASAAAISDAPPGVAVVPHMDRLAIPAISPLSHRVIHQVATKMRYINATMRAATRKSIRKLITTHQHLY